MNFVVDASVALKWFLVEPDSRQAIGLLRNEHALHAPDLPWTEVANAVWKRARRGDITPAEAMRIVADAADFAVTPHQADHLLPDALDLASSHGRTVYNCLYLALALRESAVLVTADARFANALAAHSIGRSIRLLSGFS